MRKCLLLLVVLCILAGCKKDGISLNIYGKWELRHQSGGWSPNKDFAVGNGNIYQFERGKRYKKFTDHQLSGQGSFDIRKMSDGPGDIVIFDGNPYGDPVIVDGSKLTIGTSVADGIESEYEKISD